MASTLPDGEWRARHRVLLWLLWAHVAGDADHLAAVRPGDRLGRAGLRDRRHLGRPRAVQARRAARAVADRDDRPADLLGADRPRLRRAAGVLLPLLRDGRGAVALRGLGPVRRGRRVRADPAGHHGRDRRLRPRRVALAVGADPLGVHLRAERVLVVTWRASERNREAFRSLVESLEEGVRDVRRRRAARDREPERASASSAWSRARCSRAPRIRLEVRRRGRQAGCRTAGPIRVTAAHRAAAGRRAARPAPGRRHDALVVGLDARGRTRSRGARTRSSSRSPTSPRSATPPRRWRARTPSWSSSRTSPRTT